MSKAPVLPDRAGIDALKAIISKRSRKHRFEMSNFTAQFCYEGDDECGTAYCIAGYASLLRPQNLTRRTNLLGHTYSTWTGSYVKDLWNVLDPDKTRQRSSRFADAVYSLWNGAGLSLYRFDQLPLAVRRKAALAVLEDFAMTGKVDWTKFVPESARARLP